MTLRDYITLVGREKWTIVGIAITAVALGLLLAVLQATTYSATARVLIKPFPSNVPEVLPPLSPDTEAAVASSQPVADLVAEELGEEPSGTLAVQPVVATEVLAFTFTTTDADEAQAAANAYANAYIEHRGTRIRDTLGAASEATETRIEETQELLGSITDQLSGARRDGDDALVDDLEARRSAILLRLGLLQDQAAQIQPESTAELSQGELIDPADRPSEPTSPDYKRTGVMSLIAGLLLGIGAALVRDYWKRSAPTSR